MNTVTQYYELQNKPAHSLLVFAGDLDAETVENIRPVLQAQLPDTCANIIVDLQRVDFLDSHGVGLFVSLLKRCHRNHGRLFVAGATGQPASVLKMVGLNASLVTYCSSRDEAALRVAREG